MSKRDKTDGTTSEPITRDDIETKFRELTGDVNDTAQRITRGAVALGAAAIVVALILFFLMGRAKGKKRTTVVEIVRV